MTSVTIPSMTAGTLVDPAAPFESVEAGATVRYTATQIALAIQLLLRDTDTTFAADSDLLFATQKAIKAYITQTVNARKFKGEPARAKTTAALAANTYSNGASGVGATLTGNSNGALAAQDGVTLVANDCLLVANEGAGANNGLYLVTQVGSGALPYILTRRADADQSTELVNATVYVSEGSTAVDQQWTCTTNAPITVGTTGLTWAQTGAGVSGITALTGDVAASGSGSVAATLAAVNSNVGTFGDATHSLTVTVNAKGLITGISAVAISGGGSSEEYFNWSGGL